MKNDQPSRVSWNPDALLDVGLFVAVLYAVIASNSKALDLTWVVALWVLRLFGSYRLGRRRWNYHAVQQAKHHRHDKLA
jgi:hypothetical protein